MDIDWFTVLLQVFNFLVLVALLRYFLYDRILRAMRQREEDFAARQQELVRALDAAERERTHHQELIRDLDGRAGELLAQARSAAETERVRLVDLARGEAQEQHRRWQRTFRQEQEGFLLELRRRAGERLCAVARRALADLAHVDLDQEMRSVLLARLAHATPERDRLFEAMRASGLPLVVRSAFPLGEMEKEELARSLEHDFGLERPPDFEEDPELICGLEFGVGAHRFGWNVAAYLEDLEAVYRESLERLEPEPEPEMRK